MNNPQIDQAAETIFKAIADYVAEVIELYRPEWKERRETTKTLVSLSSASLIFSVTFSGSIIKPWTPLSWRYSLLICWVSLACSLACAISSLWFSMSLDTLPALIHISRKQTIEKIKTAIQEPNFGDTQAKQFIGEHTRKLGRQDGIARWSLRASLAFFVLALVVLTIVGVQQLLY
jgi:hypothetical protein